MKFTAFEPFYSRLDMDITQEVVDIWGYYIIFYKYIMTFQSVDDIYVIITIISDHISCLIFFYESHLYPSLSCILQTEGEPACFGETFCLGILL
jgi:hypothetical protein